jgi:PAS domain S-box-containing protein
MSIQSVRLQTAYRHLLASSATAAINIGRVNGLIYAIVMESRGIYISTDRTKAKQFGRWMVAAWWQSMTTSPSNAGVSGYWSEPRSFWRRSSRMCPRGIVANDARSLRYVFVNRAAEQMIGMSRAELMGKTARELFSKETAELLERRDRQLLGQEQQLDAIIGTVDNPVKGRRTVAIRRLQVDGPDRESHLLVSMIEDRTDQANVAGVAA